METGGGCTQTHTCTRPLTRTHRRMHTHAYKQTLARKGMSVAAADLVCVCVRVCTGGSGCGERCAHSWLQRVPELLRHVQTRTPPSKPRTGVCACVCVCVSHKRIKVSAQPPSSFGGQHQWPARNLVGGPLSCYGASVDCVSLSWWCVS